MSKFKYVSLFSGIGGFEQALNKLGGECVLASEIDKFANKSYEIIYGHKTIGDITKVHEKNVPDHDLLVGGFPCQAFSVAGKRRGFADTRGTLFFELARIANEKKPKAIILENVKGLVNHKKGDTLRVIMKALNDIGYTTDFNILNSKYFGVPQNRERWICVALRNDLIGQEEWIGIEGKNMLPKARKRILEDGVRTFNFEWPEQTEVTKRLRDVLEAQVDEKYYLSEDKASKLVAELEEREESQELPIEGLPIREATTNGYAVAAEGDSVNIQFPNSKTRRGRVGTQMANTLEASGCNQGVVEEVRPVITPDRTDKRQNGRRFKDDGEESFTLTAQDRHGVAIGNAPMYRIRKLTPLECFRLQAFPDEVFYKLKDNGLSDSQLYKQAGNAVTVNVIHAVAKRLIKYLKES